MSTTHRDPRSIITPDAFEVSAELVGMPLALPRKRAMALLIDGLVILGITLVTNSFSLIVGVVAAILFVRAGFKRTEVRNSVWGRAMRFSVGCLGVFIGLTTAALWGVFGPFGDRGGPGLDGEEAARIGRQVASGLEAAGLVGELDLGETREDALEGASDFLEDAEDLGLDPSTTRAILLAAAPASADWADDWGATLDSLLQRRVVTEPDLVVGAAREDVAGLSDEEALRAYAASLGVTDTDSTESRRRGALRERLLTVVAADTIRRLEARIDDLADDVEDTERRAARLSSELEDEQDRGIARRLLELADELGFGFGWAGIYLTVVMSWWNGQTVGKRLMRIRVVRLDGEPITWWVAFERAGGYAAGLFTGLLGFAQVWWDANRQAIHDRIVGTVVVDDGAAKVLDWESAL